MLTKAKDFLFYTTRGRLTLVAMVVAFGLLVWLILWLTLPLVQNQTVDESFPLTANATIPENMTRAETEDIMATAEKEVTVVDEAMPSFVGQKLQPAPRIATPTPAPTATPTPAPTTPPQMPANSQTPSSAPVPTATPTPIPPTTTPEPSADPPIAIKQGQFKGADSFHRGSGSATMYQLPDGEHLLRFEDFTVTNGPRLHVYLSRHPDPDRSSSVVADGHLDLGRLKGNRGNQNYEIPSGIDISEYNSVVIYCVPFRVVFSVAPLN